MEFAYRPEVWESLFDMAALAAVTLTGLLSVALSINVATIVASPAHLARAREALILLTVLLTVAIFVLIPQQGRVALGVELIVVGIVVLVVTLRLQTRTLQRLHPQHRQSWIRRLIVLDIAPLSIAMGGIGLVTGRLGGFLWLLPTILISLVWSTYNCWSLVISAADPHQGEPKR